MRSSFDFFFFSFLRKYRIYQIGITPGVVTILDFRDFWIFKKCFRKMQSRADGEGKCPTMEGGFDICMFGVAAGKGMLVGRTLESEGDYHIVEGEEYIIYELE